MFHGTLKGVSRKIMGVFLETINGDSRELQGHLKEVQWVFQGIFKAVLKTFEGSFMGVLQKGQACFKKI